MAGKLIQGSLVGLLIVGYPFIVYYLLANGLPLLGAGLVLGMIIWKVKSREDWLLWAVGLLLIFLLVGYFFGAGFISKLSPLLIHVSLCWLFASSLKSTPLIERFARLDFPQLPPEIEIYCRKLTLVWTGFFALNVLVCIWLAWFEEAKIWALYNGLYVYLLIGLLIVGEYIWRRLRFPDLDIPSFRQTVDNMIKNGHQVWAAGDEKPK